MQASALPMLPVPLADLDATQVHCPNVIPLQSGSFVCLFLYIITSTRKIKPE
jgi:hypothetical protein